MALRDLRATPVNQELALAAIVATPVIPESPDIVATLARGFPAIPVIPDRELAVIVVIVATPDLDLPATPGILVTLELAGIRVTRELELAGTPATPATPATLVLTRASSAD